MFALQGYYCLARQKARITLAHLVIESVPKTWSEVEQLISARPLNGVRTQQDSPPKIHGERSLSPLKNGSVPGYVHIRGATTVFQRQSVGSLACEAQEAM